MMRNRLYYLLLKVTSNVESSLWKTLCFAKMSVQHYADRGPVDCSVEPDLGQLKGKSVIITGGALHICLCVCWTADEF